MTTGSSPWSREGVPSATLPPPVPPAPTLPPAGASAPVQIAPPPRPRNRQRMWAALRLLLVVGVAAVVGSAVTYTGMRSTKEATKPSQTVSPTPIAPQFSPAEATAAKQNLCHVVDLSVGQKGEGGFRVEGNLNIPVTLKAVNSAVAVQSALVPAVPADVAAAARKYVNTTLDATTAAMGNAPTAEVNRLTDISNEAIYALIDACGLPR